MTSAKTSVTFGKTPQPHSRTMATLRHLFLHSCSGGNEHVLPKLHTASHSKQIKQNEQQSQ